jgi:hypothetical protein
VVHDNEALRLLTGLIGSMDHREAVRLEADDKARLILSALAERSLYVVRRSSNV